VQVDPMKSTLKEHGFKRLKLKCDTLLSSFALNFNLRRYNKGCESISGACTAKSGVGESCGTSSVGRCRLTLSNPR